MKFSITFKTPHYALENDVIDLDISREEKEALYNKLVSKWFKYGEYATIEVDTEADTATVVKNN